jgi:hypothetical protein
MLLTFVSETANNYKTNREGKHPELLVVEL